MLSAEEITNESRNLEKSAAQMTNAAEAGKLSSLLRVNVR
jgi:hypothetical protein